jgi:RNA polymerase sigma-70 factor (ECF subfamily)
VIGEEERDADAVAAAAWVAGHDGALKLAYDTFGSLLYTYCMRSLNDRGLAADCVQETFVGAWRNRHRYDPSKGSLAGWLMGIARYKVIDAHRASPRVPVPIDEPHEHGDPEAQRAPADADQLADRMLVAHALRELPDRARQVIELAFYSDLSQTEIADRLALPLGTVKSDMRRGLQRMRAHLEGGATHG